MLRLLAAAMLIASAAAPQDRAQGVLEITAALPDAGGHSAPVPRHRLLISDDPPTASPRLVVTGLDGTATVRLRPGRYVVESDRPVVVRDKAYSWIQQVTVGGGTETVLELTAVNAEVETATATDAASSAIAGSDPAFLTSQWQHSVVTVWTETTRASGFVIGGNGLIATTQQVIGATRSVSVQLSPQLKVAASVLAYDVEHDVTVIQVAPAAVAAIRHVPLPCSPPAQASVESGEEVFALRASPQGPARISSRRAARVDSGIIVLDLELASDSAGGPVFSARGVLTGVATFRGEDRDAPEVTRVVRAERMCSVVTAAIEKMRAVVPPDATPLPLEPTRAFPPAALKETVERRAGSLNPYQLSSPGFDIAFITPVHTYGAQYQSEQMRRRRTSSGDTRAPALETMLMRPVMDFAHWSDYVWEFPPVLLVRVTPKLAEGFWTMVARAAARTQGVALPPMKRYKPGFLRMEVLCGTTSVTPIHPFKLERQVSETDAIFEGLYVLDPGALGPHCGTVTLVLFSEQEPTKGERQPIDPKLIQHVWDDFAAYRAAG